MRTRPPILVHRGSRDDDRHLFIDAVGRVSFYHYDPYAQLLSKVVRGFNRDMQDAENLIRSGMFDPELFRSLVQRRGTNHGPRLVLSHQKTQVNARIPRQRAASSGRTML